VIGGGQVADPGEVSLAYSGILLLDKQPEFKRHMLEVLRQPIENDVTRIQSHGHPRPHNIGSAGRTGKETYGFPQSMGMDCKDGMAITTRWGLAPHRHGPSISGRKR
jgi:Magnesium chelatase, subunit ChlI